MSPVQFLLVKPNKQYRLSIRNVDVHVYTKDRSASDTMRLQSQIRELTLSYHNGQIPQVKNHVVLLLEYKRELIGYILKSDDGYVTKGFAPQISSNTFVEEGLFAASLIYLDADRFMWDGAYHSIDPHVTGIEITTTLLGESDKRITTISYATVEHAMAILFDTPPSWAIKIDSPNPCQDNKIVSLYRGDESHPILVCSGGTRKDPKLTIGGIGFIRDEADKAIALYCSHYLSQNPGAFISYLDDIFVMKDAITYRIGKADKVWSYDHSTLAAYAETLCAISRRSSTKAEVSNHETCEF